MFSSETPEFRHKDCKNCRFYYCLIFNEFSTNRYYAILKIMKIIIDINFSPINFSWHEVVEETIEVLQPKRHIEDWNRSEETTNWTAKLLRRDRRFTIRTWNRRLAQNSCIFLNLLLFNIQTLSAFFSKQILSN